MAISTKLKMQLWMNSVGSFVFAPIRWLLEYFERRKQAAFAQQLALARVQADAQREMFTSMMSSMETMVKEMGDTSRQQSAILQEWLKGFRTVEMPSTSTIREEDEAQAERRRLLEKQGFPVDAPGEEQMRWLFEKMGEE
jgi:hypothetical protein